MRENRTSGSESGDWKRDRGAGLRPEAKATETPPDPIVNAPVLDSTEERRRATKALRLTATGYQGHERIIDFRLFRSRMIRTAGRAPGSQANGSFPKGTGRLSEKSPAGYPPPHHRDAPPGSAGVPPACCPLGCRSVSLRCCSRPPCRRQPHGPGRSRGRAPLPVDSGGGDGRSCGRICAGVPPALPGSLHLMTSSYQGHKIAEAF